MEEYIMEMESRGYNRWDWRHHIHRLGRFNVLSVILNTNTSFFSVKMDLELGMLALISIMD